MPHRAPLPPLISAVNASGTKIQLVTSASFFPLNHEGRRKWGEAKRKKKGVKTPKKKHMCGMRKFPSLVWDQPASHPAAWGTVFGGDAFGTMPDSSHSLQFAAPKTHFGQTVFVSPVHKSALT